MRLHSLEHVPFEDLAEIGVWAENKGYNLSRTRFYVNDQLPALSEIDWLVVMGGPMNIYEEDRYPWLTREKAFIADAISQRKLVLGICLGAQLIADVLGGPVSQNQFKEIGWLPVRLSAAASSSPLFHNLPLNSLPSIGTATPFKFLQALWGWLPAPAALIRLSLILIKLSGCNFIWNPPRPASKN